MGSAMKIIPLALTAVAFSALVGCGGADSVDPSSTADDLSSDKCAKPALAAAEAEYGNDPTGTHVKVLTKSKLYKVTVGEKNEEDGPVDYYVTFPSGCSSTPSVKEVPFNAPPLQGATHTAYTKIFNANHNTIASSYETTASSLPSAAHTQYNTYKKQGNCSAVTAYEVTVSGEKTYAVDCEVIGDSIIRDIVIWDSSGGDIDQCSIYGTKDVGVNGVSWQNETFEQQDP
jgi:hypothetical protein